MSILSRFETLPPARVDTRGVDRAAAALGRAQRVLVITGAGLSADSGLPTYRGVGGLYDTETTEDGLPIEDALSGAMFQQNPALVWKYIAQIESACRSAGPNAGHRALAALGARYERLCVLTQNVDGFHCAAGSHDVIEMHGDLHCLVCTQCGKRLRVYDYSGFEQVPPLCGHCGSMLRPQVVLFGEMLPHNAVSRYERALAAGFDAVVAVGTTAVFPYIAEPVRRAWQTGATTIEVNPQETDISRFCDISIRQRAASVLATLAERLTTGHAGQ